MGTPWDFIFDSDSDDMTLDSTGQLAVTQSFTELVGLRIRTRLRTVQGEHFLNRNLGVPYYEEVLVKNPDVESVNNLLISSMADVEGVQKVLEFESTFDRETRVFHVRFKVIATNGEIAEGEL